jgi:creatinine amidohydrolase
VDIVQNLAAYGPRRFYVLNTGVFTLVPLRESAAQLAAAGVLMRFTCVLTVAAAAEATVRQQPEGTLADEIETSMMPSGIYGDATLATRESGRVVVEAMVAGMLREIDDLRQAALPKRPVHPVP